jgi:hypothetical protein
MLVDLMWRFPDFSPKSARPRSAMFRLCVLDNGLLPPWWLLLAIAKTPVCAATVKPAPVSISAKGTTDMSFQRVWVGKFSTAG